MLKIQEIRELIKLIDESSIDEFKFEQNGSKLSIRKNKHKEQQVVVQQQETPVIPPVQQAPQGVQEETTLQTANTVSANEATVENNKEETSTKKVEEDYHVIKSPMVGTFYIAPSPDSPPYVKVGDKVTEETIVCIVEAMKLMNEIEAEVNGEIVEVLAKNGELVEYGQGLFLVKPE